MPKSTVALESEANLSNKLQVLLIGPGVCPYTKSECDFDDFDCQLLSADVTKEHKKKSFTSTLKTEYPHGPKRNQMQTASWMKRKT